MRAAGGRAGLGVNPTTCTDCQARAIAPVAMTQVSYRTTGILTVVTHKQEQCRVASVVTITQPKRPRYVCHRGCKHCPRHDLLSEIVMVRRAHTALLRPRLALRTGCCQAYWHAQQRQVLLLPLLCWLGRCSPSYLPQVCIYQRYAPII